MIETKDLILRKAVFDDWKDLYENIWRHAESAKYMLWKPTASEEEAKARMMRTIDYERNHEGGFIVQEKASGRAIGFAGITEIGPGTFEDTGIAIGPGFVRRGYGKQVVNALVDFAFGTLDGERFVYSCRERNEASIALASSCGFVYTHSELRNDPRNGEEYTINFYEKRRKPMKQVNITTLGHACFLLECDGYRTVIDPYAWGMVPGQPDLHVVADAVYCSHQHDDHNFLEAVALFAAEKPAPYTVTEYTIPHDDKCGALRGMNTVRIFDFGGLRVAHLGDIGCFPDEELENALYGIDCMLIPVGGYYTIGTQTAYQIIRAAGPKVAIPMHYRTDDTGFDVLYHIDDFAKLWNEVRYADDTFTLTPDTEKQILILNYNHK